MYLRASTSLGLRGVSNGKTEGKHKHTFPDCWADAWEQVVVNLERKWGYLLLIWDRA